MILFMFRNNYYRFILMHPNVCIKYNELYITYLSFLLSYYYSAFYPLESYQYDFLFLQEKLFSKTKLFINLDGIRPI